MRFMKYKYEIYKYIQIADLAQGILYDKRIFINKRIYV